MSGRTPSSTSVARILAIAAQLRAQGFAEVTLLARKPVAGRKLVALANWDPDAWRVVLATNDWTNCWFWVEFLQTLDVNWGSLGDPKFKAWQTTLQICCLTNSAIPFEALFPSAQQLQTLCQSQFNIVRIEGSQYLLIIFVNDLWVSENWSHSLKVKYQASSLWDHKWPMGKGIHDWNVINIHSSLFTRDWEVKVTAIFDVVSS